VESIYGSRKIYYREDPGEALGDDTPDGAIRLLSLPSSTSRTLYANSGAPDVDHLVFAGTAGSVYTVATDTRESLKNGGDTIITVFHTSGTTTVTDAQNDNYSGANYMTCDPFGNNCPANGDRYNSSTTPALWLSPAPLASKVTFTAPITGDYYIRLETTPKPGRPDSAGRYGTCILTVTSP
jgi:hypothetical protein